MVISDNNTYSETRSIYPFNVVSAASAPPLPASQRRPREWATEPDPIIADTDDDEDDDRGCSTQYADCSRSRCAYCSRDWAGEEHGSIDPDRITEGEGGDDGGYASVSKSYCLARCGSARMASLSRFDWQVKHRKPSELDGPPASVVDVSALCREETDTRLPVAPKAAAACPVRADQI